MDIEALTVMKKIVLRVPVWCCAKKTSAVDAGIAGLRGKIGNISDDRVEELH